jgi:hypothetical protein
MTREQLGAILSNPVRQSGPGEIQKIPLTRSYNFTGSSGFQHIPLSLYSIFLYLSMTESETSGTVDFSFDGSTYQTWYKVYGDLKGSGKRPLVAVHGGPGMSHH